MGVREERSPTRRPGDQRDLWLLEASNHVLFFADSDVFEAVFAPTWHELWMRLTVVAAIMAFATLANSIVNARRKAEDAATRALSEVDQVFETAADGMRIVDRNFRVLKANETFAKLVGLPKNEIIGRKCHDVFWGEMCESPGCPLTRILEGEKDVEYDADKVRPNGTSIPCIVSATPFRRPDGTIVGIVEDFKDISERKQAERDMRNSEERLRELTAHLQSIREEERSRIAREIHDELGQVLTALSLDVHWLQKRMARRSLTSSRKKPVRWPISSPRRSTRSVAFARSCGRLFSTMSGFRRLSNGRQESSPRERASYATFRQSLGK